MQHDDGGVSIGIKAAPQDINRKKPWQEVKSCKNPDNPLVLFDRGRFSFCHFDGSAPRSTPPQLAELEDVVHLSISHNGAYIAGACDDGKVFIWNMVMDDLEVLKAPRSSVSLHWEMMKKAALKKSMFRSSPTPPGASRPLHLFISNDGEMIVYAGLDGKLWLRKVGGRRNDWTQISNQRLPNACRSYNLNARFFHSELLGPENRLSVLRAYSSLESNGDIDITFAHSRFVVQNPHSNNHHNALESSEHTSFGISGLTRGREAPPPSDIGGRGGGAGGKTGRRLLTDRSSSWTKRGGGKANDGKGGRDLEDNMFVVELDPLGMVGAMGVNINGRLGEKWSSPTPTSSPSASSSSSSSSAAAAAAGPPPPHPPC